MSIGIVVKRGSLIASMVVLIAIALSYALSDKFVACGVDRHGLIVGIGNGQLRLAHKRDDRARGIGGRIGSDPTQSAQLQALPWDSLFYYREAAGMDWHISAVDVPLWPMLVVFCFIYGITCGMKRSKSGLPVGAQEPTATASTTPVSPANQPAPNSPVVK